MNKKISICAVTILAAASLSSCAGLTQQSGPDPLPANVKPPKVVGAYQLPDGFRNVVEFCNTAGDSLAITSRGSNTAGGQNGGGLTSTLTLVKLKDERCTGAQPTR